MKFFSFILFAIFAFSSCGPINLDDKRSRRKAGDSDDAGGELKLPTLKDIDLSETRRNLKGCRNHKNYSSFSSLGVTGGLQNCLAKALDDGLAPLCEETKKTNELIDHYEDEGDDESVEALEDHLLELEEMKYELADEIYAIADEFEKIEGKFEDKIAEDEDEDDSISGVFIRGGLRIFNVSEVGGFRRVLDSRAKRACGRQIDLKRISERK